MPEKALTLTPFIGRAQEIDEVVDLLRDPACRLLTLVGPGGIGKTRLALEVASRLHDQFPDGIYFVPLAPLCLCEPDDIMTTIAGVMPFRFHHENRGPREQFSTTCARNMPSACCWCWTTSSTCWSDRRSSRRFWRKPPA